MTTPETPCAAVEESLSAFLDGELAAGAAAEALEHAFACASCRRFFLAAKRLQTLAPGLEREPAVATTAATDAGDELWRRIRAASGLAGAPAESRRRPPAAGWLRAAALVALGLGGGYILAPSAGGPVASSAPAAAAAPAMDEQRFVALAQELLAADPRYQRTMLQVLRLVPALETGEGLDNPEDRGFIRARAEEDRPARGSV